MDGKILPAAPTTSYRRSPWGAVISIVTALIYGVSPIDLIPDLIPILGWLDDLVLIPLLLMFAWSLWRKRRARTVAAG